MSDQDLHSALIEIKNAQQLSFWTGAGISLNSGIPVTREIIKCVVNDLSGSEVTAAGFFEKYEAANLPFELFMQTIINLSNDDQLLEIFERGEPNKTHRLIAQLCQKGRVKEIYTTNFDTLHEKSLMDEGLGLTERFKVFKNETSYKTGLESVWQSDREIKIFKVHGSIDEIETVRTSIDTIARQGWMEERTKLIQHAFTNDSSLLIVLGYSFSDVFDINPAIEALTQRTKQRICIVKHSESSQFKIDDFSNLNVSVVQINTDVFISKVEEALGINAGNFTRKSLTWRNKIKKWSDRLIPSHREYILSQLFFLLKETEDAITWNSLSLQKARSNNLLKNEVDILVLSASIFHQIGENQDIDRSKTILKEALNKSVKLRFMSGIARGLQLLGVISISNEDNHVYAKKVYSLALMINERIRDKQGQGIAWLGISSCLRHEQNHLAAIEACERSLKIRHEIGDIRGAARCYQGLGNIHLELENFDLAKSNYEQFESLSAKIGDKWSSATANYQLATLHYSMSKPESLIEALVYCERSLQFRKRKKNREYANAIYLKGKIMNKLQRFKEAKEFHLEAYNFRASVPNKADLADSLFEIGLLEVNQKDYSGFKNISDSIDIYIEKGYLIQLKNVRQELQVLIQNQKSDDLVEALLVKIENSKCWRNKFGDTQSNN